MSLGAGLLLDDGSPTTLNAIARGLSDGAANFAFVDGHVARHTIQETLQQRPLGDRFFSVTGNNAVQP